MVSSWQIYFLLSQRSARGGGRAPVSLCTSIIQRRPWRPPTILVLSSKHPAMFGSCSLVSPSCQKSQAHDVRLLPWLTSICAFIIPGTLFNSLNQPRSQRHGAAGTPAKSERFWEEVSCARSVKCSLPPPPAHLCLQGSTAPLIAFCPNLQKKKWRMSD